MDPEQDIADAIALLRRGDLARAEQRCAEILWHDATIAAAHAVHGAIAYAREEFPEAVEAFGRATHFAPNDSLFANGLGAAHLSSGALPAAGICFETAVRLQPTFVEAWINLGGVRLRQKVHYEAAEAFRKVTELAPDRFEGHLNLGVALRELGRLDEAEQALEYAVRICPDSVDAQDLLGSLYRSQGKFAQAAHAYLALLGIQPENTVYQQNLLLCLSHLPWSPNDPRLGVVLQRILESPHVNCQNAVGPALAWLETQSCFRSMLRGGDNWNLNKALYHPLFLSLLRHTVLTDLRVELVLTRVRYALLIGCAAAREELPAALAIQCFHNEFVFSIAREEARRVADLASTIDGAIRDRSITGCREQSGLLLLAMYRPLSSLRRWRDLRSIRPTAWSPLVRTVIQRHIEDGQTEAELAMRIKPLTPIRDHISTAVTAQYEENPYPRWLSFDRGPGIPADTLVRTLFPHRRHPAPSADRLRILVAGCGTGRHAAGTATRFRNCDVLALDVSLASLAYAARMASELRIDNIDFRRADILGLPSAAIEEFDIIECVGVLHHMRQPLRGLRILVDLLKPGGLLKLGLYSKRARTDLAALRVSLALRRRKPTPHAIRAFREHVQKLAADNPSIAKLTKFSDFYTLSGCRDLAFNVQERHFTLPQIARALAKHHLDFVGFEFARETQAETYRAAFPGDAAQCDLSHWNALERRVPDLFAGMYQFWCQKRLDEAQSSR